MHAFGPAQCNDSPALPFLLNPDCTNPFNLTFNLPHPVHRHVHFLRSYGRKGRRGHIQDKPQGRASLPMLCGNGVCSRRWTMHVVHLRPFVAPFPSVLSGNVRAWPCPSVEYPPHFYCLLYPRHYHSTPFLRSHELPIYLPIHLMSFPCSSTSP
jgi:hypothetical protein